MSYIYGTIILNTCRCPINQPTRKYKVLFSVKGKYYTACMYVNHPALISIRLSYWLVDDIVWNIVIMNLIFKGLDIRVEGLTVIALVILFCACVCHILIEKFAFGA